MFILTFYSCSLVLSNVDMLHSKEFSLDRILNPVFYVIFKRETFFESLYSESCFELSLDTVHFNYVLFSFVQPNVNYFLIKQKTHRYRKRQQRQPYLMPGTLFLKFPNLISKCAQVHTSCNNLAVEFFFIFDPVPTGSTLYFISQLSLNVNNHLLHEQRMYFNQFL